MNRNDVICLLTTLDRFKPGYAEWRSEQAGKLAQAHGTAPGGELQAMVDSMARTLCDVSTEEAAAVVEGMETGEIPVPFFGELISTIRTAAMDLRRGRKEAERYDRENQPRYKCLDCEDRGHVTVYNPAFLDWLRPRFEECTDNRSFPENWYRQAVGKWNHKVVGVLTDGGKGLAAAPAEVGLVCRCDCDNAKVFRRQLHAMIDSIREKREKPKRSAYVGQWTPGRQCVATFDPHADLTAWFSEHAAGHSDEWAPDLSQYAGSAPRG